MKTSLIALSLLALAGLSQAQIYMPDRPASKIEKSGTIAKGLTNITGVKMNAAIASIDTAATTPYFIFSNVRASSATTTMNDLLRVRYPVSKTTLDLKSAQVEIFKGLGVFDEINTLFMKDVSTIAPMKYGTAVTNYTAGYFHTFNDVNGTKPFVLDLVSGQSLGLHFDALSTPCYVVLTRSSTAPAASAYTGLIASNFYQSKIGVLDSGKYYLWLKPQTGGVAGVRFAFFNENASNVSTVVHNTTISGSLRSTVRDYLKWKIRLIKGQDLVINQTSGSDVQWRVVANDSTVAGNFLKNGYGTVTFSPLVNAPETGDYYLIAEKTAGTSGTSIRATVSIAP